MRSSLLLVVMQRILVGSYRRFGMTYWSLLQGSSCPVQAVLDSVKMGPIGFPETGDYQYTLRKIQKSEDLNFQATPTVSVSQRLLLVCDFIMVRLVQPSGIIFIYIFDPSDKTIPSRSPSSAQCKYF
jgi:hypothetical protein